MEIQKFNFNRMQMIYSEEHI